MRVTARTDDEIAAALPQLLQHVREHGLIAYPTETVYGFGGAATPQATAALRRLKHRSTAKPFLLLVGGPDQAPGVQWTDASRAIARLFWPGPLTLVLPADPDAFPAGIAAEDGTVALRASPHRFVRTLTRALGGAITSTSANAPGHPPARDADEAQEAVSVLGADNVLIVDGGLLPESRPSTILAVSGDRARVIRSGAIALDVLRNQLSGIGVDVR